MLSERPEYLTGNRGEVIERMLAAQVRVSELDRTLILHTSELDRLCGYAVRSLTSRAPAAVLDVLGALDPERIVAMFYALPEHRRAAVRRDPVWGYHIDQAPEDVPDAIAEIEHMAQYAQETADNLARLGAYAPGAAKKAEFMERVVLQHEAGCDG